jgi:bacillaene synthase trans-acting acyltransferase
MQTDIKTVFMFSGQGSHYFQMGRPLFEGNPIFRTHMLRLDAMVRESIGTSVVEMLYSPANGIAATFDRTRITHPAIFMVEYSTAQALMHAGVVPDIVLGTSLGSFVAATLAGCIALEDALTAVIRHALTIEEHCQPGGMIAVLADPALYDEKFLRSTCECAAVNFSSHFVISATQAQCTNIQNQLDSRDIPWQRLAVSHAFHSRWIDEARSHFESSMKSVPLKSGTLPLVCCDRAATLSKLHSAHFWDVTRHPIRFPPAIAGLEQKGTYRYVDAGPSGTLATIMKYVLPSGSRSVVHATLTPHGDDLRNWALLTERPR